jgi:hypothetical protein
MLASIVDSLPILEIADSGHPSKLALCLCGAGLFSAPLARRDGLLSRTFVVQLRRHAFPDKELAVSKIGETSFA